MIQDPNEEQNKSLTKFELMLKSNDVYFFDSIEFETIVHYYLNNGKVSLAKKAVKLGLEQHPTSIALKLLEVEIHVIENKLDKAEKFLDRIYELEPNNEEVFIQKANILSKKDDHLKAIDALKIALDLSNEKADIYSLLGMEYLFLDSFENAKQCFIQCLGEDEEDYTSLYNVIYCFEFLDQQNEAINYLNSFLDRNPYCEVAWHQIGKLYFAIKEYKKALASFDFAIISDDLFIGAYLEKGKTLEQLGKYSEAIENYAITLELDDPTSFALLRIGKCYERIGHHKTAAKYYHQTIKEDPLLDKGWLAIVDYYIQLKDYHKALYFINNAIDIDEQNIKYWKKYAFINIQLQLYEEAEIGYRNIINLGNYELYTWTQRADILYRLGELPAAVENLVEAKVFYPENAEIEFRLAGLYFTLKQQAKALEHLKFAMSLEPEFHIILEELFPKAFQEHSFQEIITKN